MVEVARPAHTEAVQTQTDATQPPVDRSTESWRDLAAGIWGAQKQAWSDFASGQLNAKDAGLDLIDEGVGLMATGAAIPVIGEPAVVAGALSIVGGVSLAIVGDSMGE